MEHAHAIAEAGGVALLVLFAPKATPDQVGVATEEDHSKE
jgi:hypothetical protein